MLILPNDGGKVDLNALMLELGRRGINEVLAESGFKLNGSLLREGCVDELILYLARPSSATPRGPLQPAGAHQPAGQAPLVFHDIRQIGPDLRILARPA